MTSLGLALKVKPSLENQDVDGMSPTNSGPESECQNTIPVLTEPKELYPREIPQSSVTSETVSYFVSLCPEPIKLCWVPARVSQATTALLLPSHVKQMNKKQTLGHVDHNGVMTMTYLDHSACEQ